MKRLMVGAFCAMLVTVAMAATLTARWNNATQNVDGTPIPASGPGSIASQRVEWGTCTGASAFGTKIGETSIAPELESTALPQLPPGRYCARIFNINTYGIESDASNVATFNVDAPKPRPPANFSIS